MKQEEHAARIWLILIAAARDRRTLTYELLGDQVGLPTQSSVEALAHIMYYCAANGLPSLALLVVSTKTGRPGAGHSRSSDLDRDREAVFDYRWINHKAPRPEDFKGYATELQSPQKPSRATSNTS